MTAPYRPSPAVRHHVSVCAGAGYSHASIAAALGISRNTLEKVFRLELSSGAARRRMEVLDALLRAAKRGNVSAMKAFLRGVKRR
ncbi:MAG: hypothetical protein Q8R33_15505 [Burkholderiales bacterium]|nr:hypothetical protein [Burkholderiales bacterium]